MTGVTREDGSYELLLDVPGAADLSIDALDGSIGFPRRRVEIPDADAHVIDVNLLGVPVTGIVVEKDTDAPIAQARVTAVLPGKPGATTIGGADGRFRFELDPGEYRVQADASEQGYGSAQAPVTVDTGGAPEIRLALSHGLSISGKAVDPGGGGLGGVSVFAQSQDTGTPSAGYGQTLPDGSFRIEGLSSGAHILSASTDSGLFAVRSGTAAGAEGVVLSMRPGGRIHLQVKGPDGSPLKGAWASATKVDGLSFDSGNGAPATDELGMTELASPAGVVEVDVRKGALRGHTTVNVSPGEVAGATVSVSEAPSEGTP